MLVSLLRGELSLFCHGGPLRLGVGELNSCPWNSDSALAVRYGTIQYVKYVKYVQCVQDVQFVQYAQYVQYVQ